MLNEEALKLFRDGRVATWNQYRERNPDWLPDLHGETIEGKLLNLNLAGADLCGANLSKARLYDNGSSLSSYKNNVSRAILTNARYDINTVFPHDVDPADGGAVFVSQAELHGKDRSRDQIFVCYAWANDDVVLAVDAWLHQKGLRTKLDKRDFFAGARIRDEIMRVMKECETILIFHSKKSADKPWPEFERELAADLEMAAKKEGRQPPQIIYVLIDDVSLPNVSEANKIAVVAKGKRFELVCEEIYHSILKLPKQSDAVDLSKWADYVF
ncbi:MAG: TIR domain-containing protein [Deltaproteobacteria bacterium]|nr:TIR domain-containing protein [Deltaproteobacteria bacterium]